MEKKISNNFSEFLQDASLHCLEKEKQEIFDLLTQELDGILKQVSMFIKSFNSTIEFEELKSKSYSVLENSRSSIDMLVKNIYDLSYQEVFSKIIRDGDYALKSNRYQANPDRIKLLETTLSNHKKNVEDSKGIIQNRINAQNYNFVDRSIISELLSCLEEVFFEIPCKQNESTYNEACNLLDRTKSIITDRLNEVCNSNFQLLNQDVSSYLENKIRFENGYTNNNFTLAQLLKAKETAIATSATSSHKRGRKKKSAAS